MRVQGLVVVLRREGQSSRPVKVVVMLLEWGQAKALEQVGLTLGAFGVPT
jgi:hypothetical protein